VVVVDAVAEADAVAERLLEQWDVPLVRGVLDVAALAAPSLVEICLGRRVHELTVAGREFLVAELVVDGAATVRELYGELAPLVIAAGAALPVVCPGHDVPVRPGDRVTAVGTLAQFAHQGVAEVVEHLRPQGPVGARVPTARAGTAARRGDAGAPPGRGRYPVVGVEMP
jgi:hypothetical protein